LLSPTSRLLVDELLRLTALLQRAVTSRDVIAAVRGDPEHRLQPAFRDLVHEQDWTGRLAWLVNRVRLEQGMPMVLTDPPMPRDVDSAAAATGCENLLSVTRLLLQISATTSSW
jgi:hypothetical protein